MAQIWECDECKNKVHQQSELAGLQETIEEEGLRFQVNVQFHMIQKVPVDVPNKKGSGYRTKIQDTMTKPDLCQTCQKKLLRIFAQKILFKKDDKQCQTEKTAPALPEAGAETAPSKSGSPAKMSTPSSSKK